MKMATGLGTTSVKKNPSLVVSPSDSLMCKKVMSSSLMLDVVHIISYQHMMNIIGCMLAYSDFFSLEMTCHITHHLSLKDLVLSSISVLSNGENWRLSG